MKVIKHNNQSVLESNELDSFPNEQLILTSTKAWEAFQEDFEELNQGEALFINPQFDELNPEFNNQKLSA